MVVLGIDETSFFALLDKYKVVRSSDYQGQYCSPIPRSTRSTSSEVASHTEPTDSPVKVADLPSPAPGAQFWNWMATVIQNQAGVSVGESREIVQQFANDQLRFIGSRNLEELEELACASLEK